jgi:hypothetical protein
MGLYGPSAATGLGAGAAASVVSGDVFWGIAAFTLIGAVFAVKRILPKRKQKQM